MCMCRHLCKACREVHAGSISSTYLHLISTLREIRSLTEPEAHFLSKTGQQTLGSSWLLLTPSTGVTDACPHTWLLCECWGYELRSLCLHSMYLTHPVPRTFLFKDVSCSLNCFLELQSFNSQPPS